MNALFFFCIPFDGIQANQTDIESVKRWIVKFE